MSTSNAFKRFGLEDGGESQKIQQAEVKPERNLLASVLSRAICDAFGNAHCERHLVREARRWIFGKLTPKTSFSFAWIVVQLDMNPAELQNYLREFEDNPGNIQDRLAMLK